MLCGRPVICSDLPGVCEVGCAETTCVVPPGDVTALAEALNRLRDDPALRERMGQAGRARALAEYDVDKLNARRWQVYQELLGAGKEAMTRGTS